jgi:hypothetical protein
MGVCRRQDHVRALETARFNCVGHEAAPDHGASPEMADRAERLARGVLDALAREALMKYARECRERANVAAPFATDQAPIPPMMAKWERLAQHGLTVTQSSLDARYSKG